jgi:hypothetical protein
MNVDDFVHGSSTLSTHARESGHPEYCVMLDSRLRGNERRSTQIQFLEEVIPLVVHHDERREILDLDLPDRLHAEFGILHDLDLLDAVLGEVRGDAANGA